MLGSLTFDQPIAGVPDMPTWTLLLTGFGATGLAMRRRVGRRLHDMSV